MKNNILKIINEKYEKYSICYRKVPEIRALGVRHSDWLPHIFRAKLIQPPPKNGPYAYGYGVSARRIDCLLAKQHKTFE